MASTTAALSAAAAATELELEPSASPGASGSSDGAGPMGPPSSADILGNIQKLKTQQKALKEERKKISAQLRNEEKRRSRIRKRARMLSDSDLVALIKMRETAGPALSSASTGSSSTSEPSA